jgi:hypothetical protein
MRRKEREREREREREEDLLERGPRLRDYYSS